jgi:2-oxoglutarate ferredoxin oxidoreductase subunit delta
MRLVIDESRCKGCNLCTMVCPYRIYKPGTSPNRRGIYVPDLDQPQRCPNTRLQQIYGRRLCGVCALICPDQAITWEAEKPYEPQKVVIEY